MKSMLDCFGIFNKFSATEAAPLEPSVNVKINLIFLNSKGAGNELTCIEGMPRCFSAKHIEETFDEINTADWRSYQKEGYAFSVRVNVIGNIYAQEINHTFPDINACHAALKFLLEQPETAPRLVS